MRIHCPRRSEGGANSHAKDHKTRLASSLGAPARRPRLAHKSNQVALHSAMYNRLLPTTPRPQANPGCHPRHEGTPPPANGPCVVSRVVQNLRRCAVGVAQSPPLGHKSSPVHLPELHDLKILFPPAVAGPHRAWPSLCDCHGDCSRRLSVATCLGPRLRQRLRCSVTAATGITRSSLPREGPPCSTRRTHSCASCAPARARLHG